MKGLLIKDFYELRRTMWIYLVMMVSFAAFQGLNGLAFLCFYVVIIPTNLISIDESTRFDRLMMTMPVSGVRIVLDKYIYAWVTELMAIVLFVGTRWIRQAPGDEMVSLPFLCLIIAVTLLVESITLPCLYRFGVERGRVIYVLAIVLIGALAGGLVGVIPQSGFELNAMALNIAGPVALAVAIALNVASVFLSARFFEKRLTA